MTSEEEDLQDGFDRSASVVAVRIAMEGEEPPVVRVFFVLCLVVSAARWLVVPWLLVECVG